LMNFKKLMLFSILFNSILANSQEKVSALWPNKNKKLEGEYNKVGKEHGTWKEWYENGKLKYEINFFNGLLYGPAKYFYENGQLENEGYFFKGIPDSLLISYYPNGNKKEEGLFRSGAKFGLWKQWYDNT